MTTALEGVRGSASRPGRSLPPGKTRYPLYRRLGGPQGRSGQVRKISPLTGIRSPDRSARSQSLYRLSCPGPQSTVSFIPTVSLKLEKFRILFTKCNDRIYMLLRINTSFSLQRTRSNRTTLKNGRVKEKKFLNLILWNSINRKAIAVCTKGIRSLPKTLTC